MRRYEDAQARAKEVAAKQKSIRTAEPVVSDQLTARDLVSALRAVSHGVDASEILGTEPRWEALFSALLSIAFIAAAACLAVSLETSGRSCATGSAGSLDAAVPMSPWTAALAPPSVATSVGASVV